MQPRSRLGRTGDLCFKRGFSPLEFIELLLKPWCSKPISYGLDQTIELTAVLFQFTLLCAQGEFGIVALSVDFGMEFLDELSNKIGVHQVLL
ncbi:MAG: hypothetical protein WCD69_17745 [Xanthobacteraceae bacterium]